MKALYLIVVIITIFFPLIASFEKNIYFIKNLRKIFQAILLSAIPFIICDIIATKIGIWGFNPKYHLSYFIFNLPIEECLFFITIPYACHFILAVTIHYNLSLPRLSVGYKSAILFFIGGIFFINHLYTALVLFTSGVLTLIAKRYLTVELINSFIVAYLIHLLPFLLVNGILTALPIVIYNPNAIIGYRIGSIPVEDLFYSYTLFLLNVIIARNVYHGNKNNYLT
jgi:lycopene cyclase domain-containing protein